MRAALVLSLIFLSTTAFADIQVKDGLVSANIIVQPVRHVLDSIREQTGIVVNVDDEVSAEMVSANFKELPIGAAVKKLLEGTGINYALIAGADGNPTAIFVGGSTKPGAPPKKLDTRPVTTPSRGIVSPAMPMAPPPVSTPPANFNRDPRAQQGTMPTNPNANVNGTANGTNANQKPGAPNTTNQFNNVPTAGSVSATPQPTPQPDQKKPVLNQKPVQATTSDDDDSDDDDDDDF